MQDIGGGTKLIRPNFFRTDNNNDHVASGDTLSHQISGSVS